jgi:hypothetical protein
LKIKNDLKLTPIETLLERTVDIYDPKTKRTFIICTLLNEILALSSTIPKTNNAIGIKVFDKVALNLELLNIVKIINNTIDIVVTTCDLQVIFGFVIVPI